MTELFGTFILATGISLASNMNDSEEQEAAFKSLMKATYKYSKADKQIKHLEDMYISNDVKKYGGYFIILGKMCYEQKITYQYSF